MPVRYINTLSTPGGTGLTNAITGTDRAYSNLAEYEAAENAVLTEVAECVCSGSTADATAVVFDGWTTTTVNRIWIHPGDSDWHSGVLDTNKYHRTAAIDTKQSNVTIEGIQLHDFTDDAIYIRTDSDDVIVDRCIVANITGHGINVAPSITATNYIRNTTIYGCSSRNLILSAQTVHCRNITSFGSPVGLLQTGGTVNITNSVFFNNTDDLSGTITALTYSAGDDSDFASGTGNIQWTGGSTDWGNNFVDYAAGDVHLVAGSDLIGAGTDLSAYFTTDIDGDTRSAWDIGADEYVAAGGQTGLLTDSWSLSETPSSLAHYSAAITDALGMGETPVGSAAYIASILDSLSVGDTITGIAGFVAALADNITVTGQESASKLAAGVLSDNLALSDSVGKIAHLLALLNDQVSVADAFGALLRSKASLSDVVSWTDQSSSLAGLIASLVDQLSYVDSVSFSQDLSGSLTDSVTFSDSQTNVAHLAATISDNIQVSDAVAGIAAYLQTLADIFSLTDIATVAGLSINGPVTVTAEILKSSVTIEVIRASTTYEII